ncbi:MAG: hypothetical protein ABSF46_31340 [Terriglobia bacterium]
MSTIKPLPSSIEDKPLRRQNALQWVMRHPGTLILSSLAIGTILASRQNTNQHLSRVRRVETQADIIDGDEPLFI